MDIEAIEQICTSLPFTHKEIKWKSDLVFMIAKKMFCVIDLESTPPTAAFKVPSEDFEELSTAMYFKPAPYFAQHKWVTVTDLNKLTADQWRKHIETSYELVKAKLSKKVLKELGIF